MKQSKNGPVAPSARNQLTAVAVTPVEPCPAAKACVGVLRYIARSTMIGAPAGVVITAETSVLASDGALCVDGDGRARVGGKRIAHRDRRLAERQQYLTVATVATGFGFCSR